MRVSLTTLGLAVTLVVLLASAAPAAPWQWPPGQRGRMLPESLSDIVCSAGGYCCAAAGTAVRPTIATAKTSDRPSIPQHPRCAPGTGRAPGSCRRTLAASGPGPRSRQRRPDGPAGQPRTGRRVAG